MLSATRTWLRRNRTSLAIGAGVLGAGYVVGQYVLSKITEARDRMSSDRIAKENLRRRFEQNQEDCTFTVLALLPTATEDILDALPVENITHQLQQKKAERAGRSASAGTSEVAASEMSSGPPSVAGDDGKSLSSFQSEGYIHASQMAASSTGSANMALQTPKKSKAQLWNELKIKSITRSYTLLYTVSLLTLLTRIQLNLLGRRNYLSSVVSLASHPLHESTISLENHDDVNAEQEYGSDFETNRKFLTFSWWLLHRGWRDIMERVEAAVKEDFGPLNPREDITMERLSTLTLDIRRKVEGATEEERRDRKWLPHLLPPRDQEEFVLQESGMTTSSPPASATSPSNEDLNDPTTPPTTPPSPPNFTTQSPPLRRLLDETSDLIDSPTFTHINTLLLDTLFSHLTDTKLRTQAFKIPLDDPDPDPDPSSLDPTTRVQEIFADPLTTPANTADATLPPDPAHTTAKLATILAVMTRQAHSIGNGVPNEYVQALESVRELDAFAAVVYSSNFEFEALGNGESGRGGESGEQGVVLESKTGEGAAEVVEGGGADVLGVEGEGRAVKGLTGGVFENVWGRVRGRGAEPITG